MKTYASQQGVDINLIEIPGLTHNTFFMWHKLGNEEKHMATTLGEFIHQMFNRET